MVNNNLIIGVGLGVLASAIFIHLLSKKQQDTLPYTTNVKNLEDDVYNNLDNNLDNTIYKNDEKWEIVRDNDGSIKSLNVIRDVKVNK